MGLALTSISAQIPGRNVNMVAGNTWPDGDPFLQRQNEPSIAASTRNPLHLLAGANDYRTVDLPGLTDDEIGDAWLGLFKSNDGGQRWTTTLLPGYPQDTSAVGSTSPIHGYGAGADPVVRAGNSGLMYYAGLVFDRSNPATPEVPGKSAIFVARYIDNNNKEAGDTFEYLGARVLQSDPGGSTGNFLDKPWMVVDVPRDATRCTIVTPGEKGPITQSIPAGPVYVAYTLRSTDNKGSRYDVMFTRSVDCGNTWTTPLRLNSNSERANQGATLAVDPRNGDVYVAWRQFDLSKNGTDDGLMVVKYVRASKQLSPVGFARKFAKPKNGKGNGINPEHFYKRGGVNKAIEAASLTPLDQSTSAQMIRFRTNAYPTMVVDETGRVYLAWAERGYDPLNPDPALGSARVLMATSSNGSVWTAPRPVSNENQKGHQLMPSLTYAGGKLMLIYYDVRETRSRSFTEYIDDRTAFSNPEATGLRHTIDLRASMAAPGAVPIFANSEKVSEYIEGPREPRGPNIPWQVNPPNLPMFQKGTAPFIGDYIDITAAPAFIVDAAGRWIYNTAPSTTLPIFHAAWTDNRDVRVPLEDRDGDGNPWNDYVPPGFTAETPSIFDPTRMVQQCIPGNAGSRNQNVYTARITGGLLVGSPGNTKTLSPELQRGFVVFVQNTSDDEKIFRLTIMSQPVGGRASFDQFPLPPYTAQSPAPLTVIEAVVPRRSTASRTVYVTSSDPHAQINILVNEILSLQGPVVTDGLSGRVILNPDIDNPDIDNPDIDNPDIDNPDIDNAEVYNPDIDNPDIDNPDIDNPDIDNPDIDNPDIDNVEVANPDIDNPDIDNPDIDNPDIDNPDIDNPDIDNPDIDNTSLMTDVSWSITNTGNTTAAYNVNLFFAQTQFDPSIQTQLILHRTYRTPVVRNCELKTETRNVVVANVPNPQLVKSSTGEVSNPNDPEATNATIYLAPGESAKITLRIFDPSPEPGSTVTVTNEDGSTAIIPNQFVPNEDVTPVVQQQGVDTEDAEEGETEPPIVVQFPAPQTVPDVVSTSQITPVRINVLANDSTAFGSTKIVSLHPAGMATHSGGPPGDVAYQPSTGFVYTSRGAIDPNTSALVGRFASPLGVGGPTAQYANPRTGINYQRSSGPVGGLLTLTALDARPNSPTFHQYLLMPALPDSVLALAIDAVNDRVFAVSAPSTSTAVTPTTVSVIDANPASMTFHQVIASVPLPAGVRPQSIAVNTRTRRVYIATTSVGGSGNGGVYVFDSAQAAPVATRIANTLSGGWSVAINEANAQVFVSTAIGPTPNYALMVIDAATHAVTMVPTGSAMRFGTPEERLAIHHASGKVLMRLANEVVIIDGQRGSPTRNTVVAQIAVGNDNNNADLAIDQELGLAVTTGVLDFKAHVIDIDDNSLGGEILLNAGPTDVTIDPVTHRAFIAVTLSNVQIVDLAAAAMGATVPVFVEGGGLVINKSANKAYAGIFSTSANVGIFSGSGFEGYVPGINPGGRYLFSDRHDASNTHWIVNQGNQPGNSSSTGTVVVIDGATDTIAHTLAMPPNPFGIGIHQAGNKVYVASSGGNNVQGGIRVFNALNPAAGAVDATFDGGLGSGPANFPLNANSVIGLGRHVIVNQATGKVYALVMGGSATSIAVLDPATNVLSPLDGRANTPMFNAQQAAGESWGRAQLIRVNETLNRVYVGTVDSLGATRIIVLDGATNQVLDTALEGGHSNRHTPSWLTVDEARQRLYVTNYGSHQLTVLNAANLDVIATLPLREGPSAQAFNASAKRLYVSSIDAKVIQAIDVSTDVPALLSDVTMPLVAYFLYVDEIESRIYTSGGDAMDESGVMIITDILGDLGTDVSVESVGSAANGTVTLNSDYSVTYTPAPGFAGNDQFNYEIEAPTGTAMGTVTVKVVPTVPTAVAFGDSYNAVAGQPLNETAPGPLRNDATLGSSTTMVVDDTTDFGSLTPNADGSFVYMPNPGFVGIDTFTYHAVTDSHGSTNAVTVTITVTNPNSLVVTNTDDTGAGSLRAALTTAQVEPNSNIAFNIPGAGPHTIVPASALPLITQPTTIDGYSQPGAIPNTDPVGSNAVIKIQVRANNNVSNGFQITGGNSLIRGLSIGGFTSSGILMELAGGNVIEGNFIGVAPDGTTATPNGTAPGNGQGISSRSANNMIGGSALAARNVISANYSAGVRIERSSAAGTTTDGTGTMVAGNLIGTDRTGNAALGNGPAGQTTGSGIAVTVPNVTIGGTTAALRNVISGNNGNGVNAFAGTFTPAPGGPQQVLSTPSNLTVQGNYIGIRADGGGALGNTSNGVLASGAGTVIGGAVGTTPGGACTGACNVIGGNTFQGVNLGASTDSVALVVTSSAANSIVEGNHIGVGPDGVTRMQNIGAGISIFAPNIRVGGSTPAQRNVIAGNTSTGVNVGNAIFNNGTLATNGAGAIISGNYIGVDTTGGTAQSNSNGVLVSPANVRIGGSVAGERNIIAGNTGHGINSSAATIGAAPDVNVLAMPSGLMVLGNYIGLGADGTTAIPNGTIGSFGGGVNVTGPNTIIGGAAPGARNVISGNNGTAIGTGSSFNNSDGAGSGQKYSEATGTQILGNYIGTDATGLLARPNQGTGVQVNAAANVIGGDQPAARNVIAANTGSGISMGTNYVATTNALVSNADGTVVRGNYIGVAADGATPMGNAQIGIAVGVPNVVIGGIGGNRNVIAGNGSQGISSFASRPSNSNLVFVRPNNLVVENNYIGVAADGATAVGNAGGGMFISGADSMIRGNLVSGNTNANPAVFASGISVGINFENSNPAFYGTIYASPDRTQVIDNIVGLNAAGTAAVPNDTGISVTGPGVVVGGPNAGERNVVSGNNKAGISLATNYVNATNTPVGSAAGTIVSGNYVGLNAAGTAAIPNLQGGINASAGNVTIGGPTAAHRNFAIATLFQHAISLQRHTNGASLINAGGSSLVQNNVVGLAVDLSTRLNARGLGIVVSSAGNSILNNVIAGLGTGAAPNATSLAVSGFPAGTADNNIIRGNLIGTNADGINGLHNHGQGITVNNAAGTIIGGIGAGEGNTIVNVGDQGISISNGGGNNTANTSIVNNRIGVMVNAGNEVAQDPARRVTTGIIVSSNGGAITGTTITGNVIGTVASNAIGLYNAGVTGTVIRGNKIGVGSDGVTAFTNAFAGVWISGSHDNTVGGVEAGDGNVIANNTQVGVGMNQAALRNRVLGNSIYDSGGLGIDLTEGANNGLGAPILQNANNAGATTRVTVDLSHLPVGEYTVQVFSNPACDAGGAGEGRTLVRSWTVVQPGAGDADLGTLVDPGHVLTATATDANGNTSEFSTCAPITGGFEVTNTNDSGPGSLRNAIENANGAPGAPVITFNIPGVTPATPAIITAVSALPTISDGVTIDATTQPGYDGKPVVRIHGPGGNNWNGFDIWASNVTIRGFSITGFQVGVFALQGQQNILLEHNIIGDTRNLLGDVGNGLGVEFRASNSMIRTNQIVGNAEGMRLIIGAAGNQVTGNWFGVGSDGQTARGNGGNAITLYDGANGNTIENNHIAANGGWGIDIQQTGVLTPVSNTVIRGNTIGLDAISQVLGNDLGGIKLRNAPGTIIGTVANRNVISGNGDIGVLIEGDVAPAPVVDGNYIGTDINGTVAGRGNVLHGIAVNGVSDAVVTNNVISGNGGNGIFVSNSSQNADTIILGNKIGTTANGLNALGNSGAGIATSNAAITVGGDNAAARNIISGNQYGILLSNSGSTFHSVIRGNYIGTDVNGANAVGNGSDGILVGSAPGTRIGGSGAGERNFIAGNNVGLNINGIGQQVLGAYSTIVLGNVIGLDVGGAALPNNIGAQLDASFTQFGGLAFGEGNTVAGNSFRGVSVHNAATRNRISGNLIKDNGGFGIDLAADGLTANDAGDGDIGANNKQNFPVLTAAVNQPGPNTRVTVDLSSFAGGNFDIEFFRTATCDPTGHGEGGALIASLGGVASGAAPQDFFMTELVPAGQFITAIAHDSNGNTSEFSACVEVIESDALVVTNTNDSGPGSLRNAIDFANLNPASTITFDISGATPMAPAVITLATRLPLLEANNTVIDGTSMPGYAGTPLVVIDGQNTGVNGVGFIVSAAAITIKGMSVVRFPTDGIWIMSNNTTLTSNFIGVMPSGAPAGNGLDGIRVNAGPNNIGTSLAVKNVISANGRYGIFNNLSVGTNTIQGNFIGTDPSGTAAMPNNNAGIEVADSAVVTIGGPGNAMNVISGNTEQGVHLRPCGAGPCSNHIIQSNRIGTNANGTFALPNGLGGIVIHANSNVQVLGNLISGNAQHGLQIIANGGGQSGHVVKGNRIGTNAAGNGAIANVLNGIALVGPVATIIGGVNAADRNLISNNGAHGIAVSTSTPGNVIEGNWIGVDINNNAAPNSGSGVYITGSTGVVVGGNALNKGNVISSNLSAGIAIDTSGTTLIQNNKIGWDSSGTVARGNNGDGVHVDSDSHTILENRIGNNGTDGVRIAAGQGNRISRNSLYDNGQRGIVLGNGPHNNDSNDTDNGPNELQNYPYLYSVSYAAGQTTVVGSLHSAPNRAYEIEFFSSPTQDASGQGEGAFFFGSITVTTNGAGNADFSVSYPGTTLTVGHFASATATDVVSGSTSAFGSNVTVDDNLMVINLLDSGVNSLRQAMINANNTPGAQTIRFGVAGVSPSNPGVISLQTELPALSGPVTIDATSQAGYDGRPVIEVTAGVNINFGFSTQNNVSGVTIKGLAITDFQQVGVYLSPAEGMAGHLITDNYIGTDRAGAAGKGNGSGVAVLSDNTTVSNNTIGGNVDDGVRVEGDADSVTISNNFIGIMGSDGSARGNGGNGIELYESLNDTVVHSNKIGNNSLRGIDVFDVLSGDVTGLSVQNNGIGINQFQAAAPNALGGIRLNAAINAVIGTTTGNAIQFNGGPGIVVLGNLSSVTISKNHLSDNTGLGIDLGGDGITANDGAVDTDNGPNGLQNFLSMSAATNGAGPQTQVTFDASSTLNPGNPYRVEFFSSPTCDASGNGEGRSYEGFANTIGGAGNVTVSLNNLVPVGFVVTATVTDAAGNTSEYGPCRQVTP